MAQLKDLIVTGSSRFLNDINGNITGSAAKLGTSNVGSATKPMYLNAGVPTECTYTLEKSVPSNAVFTDTKVTSVDNHYTPIAASASKITITSTGGYPKTIEISRDAKGHVTAATVTETEVIPDNDFNVTQTEVTTDNNYEVTFSGTASTATKTEGVGKSAGFIYNPSRKAVTVGSRNSSTVIGNHSSVLGEGCEASGRGSHAEGFKTTASGLYSHAGGNQTLSSGENSHSEGTCTTASGGYSHAEGYYTCASGYGSHAEGNHTLASQSNAHAEGAYTTASDISAHAEGAYTQATTAGAHAEGYASSAKPHIASGLGAHVEGYGTSVGGNTASGVGSHAEGFRTLASGDYSHVEGSSTCATEINSHAEGSLSKASGATAHAEGGWTIASGGSSHAEGARTTASGYYSHAECFRTIASGDDSHAEGLRTVASGSVSHAEGSSTTASGYYSHAEGQNTIANHRSQHVFGELNLADASTVASTDRGNYIEIVGNGLNPAQLSNARTLDWDGNEWLGGKLYSKGVVAQSSGTENVRVDYYQISVNDTQESHTALWIHSDDIVLPDVQIDQEVYENTWDGVNNSLKGTFQHTPYMDTSGTYPWLKAPGNTTNWIRIGADSGNERYGIIPASSGDLGSGHGSIGTATWAWDSAHIDKINCKSVNGIRIHGGTWVKQVTASGTHAFCTNANMNSWFGVTNCSNGNCVLYVMNGDDGAQAGKDIDSTYYNNGTWYVRFRATPNAGAYRFNYVVIYFG